MDPVEVGGFGKRDGCPLWQSDVSVVAVWSAFIIFNSRFDRWFVLGGSGAGPELKIYIL